jgi:hypothetical protein
VNVFVLDSQRAGGCSWLHAGVYLNRSGGLRLGPMIAKYVSISTASTMCADRVRRLRRGLVHFDRCRRCTLLRLGE